MFALLELLGGLFGLLDLADTTTRAENRPYVQSVLLLCGFAVVAVASSSGPDGLDGALVAAVMTAQIAAAVLLVTAMHGLRRVDPDFPARTWVNTLVRSLGPLCLAMLGALIVWSGAISERDSQWPWLAGVGGGVCVVLGLAMLVRAARSPF